MDSEGQAESAGAVEPDLADTSGNGLSYTPDRDPQSGNVKRPHSDGVAEKNDGMRSTKRRGTGPRTQEGKNRSRLNACRHGLFSKVALLRHEARTEFEDLLDGFRNDLQPVGKLENLGVDQLAVAYWRKHRWLIAEGAEIQKSMDFVEWEKEQEHEERAARISSSSTNYNGGLIATITNPKLLERCLDLLAGLKDGIKQDGFDPEYDKQILTKLCGEYREADWRHTLFTSYLIWLSHSLCPDKKRENKGIASPEEAKQNFLYEIELEEKRLHRVKKDRAVKESARLKLESLSRNIPAPAEMDRLLRYGTSIDREIDRLLKQLERLQRMRLGQLLPPPIDVNVSLE